MFISIDKVGVKLPFGWLYDKIILHNYNTYKKCILENALSGNWIHSIQRFVNNIFDLVLEFKIFFTILL